MSFASRKKSSVITPKEIYYTLLMGVLTCVLILSLGLMPRRVCAQVSGLNAQQRQSLIFMFGLGSSTVNERYDNNESSVNNFEDLIRQHINTPSSRIDSIVITSYSTTADELGNIDAARRRSDALRKYIETVIQEYKLSQNVALITNVASRNNVLIPSKIFNLLRQVTVTIYTTGISDYSRDVAVSSVAIAPQKESIPRVLTPDNNSDIERLVSSSIVQIPTKTPTLNLKIEIVSKIPEVSVLHSTEDLKDSLLNSIISNFSGNYLMETEPIHEIKPKSSELESIGLSLMANPLVATETPEENIDLSFIENLSIATDLPDQSKSKGSELDNLISSFIANNSTVTESPVERVVTEMIPETSVIPIISSQPIEEIRSVMISHIESPKTPIFTKTHDSKAPVFTKVSTSSSSSAVFDFEVGRGLDFISDDIKTHMIRPRSIQESQIKELGANHINLAFSEIQDVKPAKKLRLKSAKEVKSRPAKDVKMKPYKDPLLLIQPKFALKTNLAYLALTIANLEVEYYFSNRWSLVLDGTYTNWDMNVYKNGSNYAITSVGPELRCWTGRRKREFIGFYIGIYGHIGQYDFYIDDKGKTGDYYGGGLSFGAYVPFTRHFGMEFNLRAGYASTNYDSYFYVSQTKEYALKKSFDDYYLGITGAKVSLVYRFSGRRRGYQD